MHDFRPARARIGAVEMAYETVGDRGPWVVLVHALGAASDMWSQSVGPLAREGRVLAYDLRGHGDTRCDPPWTMEELADDVARLMDHVGIYRGSVVGAAMGGMIGQLFAGRYPHRLERLVIANAPSHIDDPDVFRQRASRARRDGMERLAAEGIQRCFTAHAPAQIVDRVRRRWAAMDPEAYAATCEALTRFDARPLHSRILAPVLVIGSDEDSTTTPEATRKVAASLPHARVEIMPRGAHFACIEDAPTFNDLVSAFLRG